MIVASLTFDGNTEEAFTFYQSVLGGELVNLQRFGDTPHAEQIPEENHQRIMHVSLEGRNGLMLIGNDHMGFTGEPFAAGNNFSVSLHPESEAEARRHFDGLSEGGTPLVPFEKAPWGAHFGMFIDRFGIKWMVNYQPTE